MPLVFYFFDPGIKDGPKTDRTTIEQRPKRSRQKWVVSSWNSYTGE
ncbi:MAG: hypothetical protein ACTHJN_11875 [Ginsengibacter sp.]